MEKYQYDAVSLSLMESSAVPFAIYQFIDKRVITLVLSQGFLDQFGFEDRAEAYYLMDHNMYRDTHPDDAAHIADAGLRFATEGGEYDVVYRSKTNGVYKIVHAHGKHVHPEPHIQLAIIWYTDEGVYQPDNTEYDSSLHQSLNKNLHEGSIYQSIQYDVLTGLPNMSYFFQLAEAGRERMLANLEKPCMLFIDLNGMKAFNRKFGFAEGDNLIRATAQALVKYFSNENCSHFGGDHFVVYTQKDGVQKLAEDFIAECRNINNGKSLPVRIGIYSDDLGEVSAAAACDRAKMACDIRRNTYASHIEYFNDSMLKQSEDRQYIIDNLDKALAEGWIHVYHQPIVRTANGKVSDEEALARWIDPELGFLAPDRFIPVLEDAQLVYKLDLYVTEQILKKMKIQAKTGLYVVPESVNLSRSDFDCCDMVEEIRARVDAAGISRDKLTIEITESVVGSDFDFIKEQVERFQSLGFSVWMDDFGSGYSSLDVLQKIHFDLIKLDMRFMEQFDKNENSRIILTELVRMAIGLGVDTVAEGVETEEQAAFLKEIGCTKLQGYYFCKPVPLEEIFNRNKAGIQIGFENPEESEYYTSIGRVNLYDISTVSNEDEAIQNYFSTMPMAILEADENELSLVRCNQSYRDFMKKNLDSHQTQDRVKFDALTTGTGSLFMRAIRQCSLDGKRTILDERTDNGVAIHILIRRIAVNPVKGVTAFAIVLLSVSDDNMSHTSLTYTYVAQALSTDYITLYYVNLETEHFIEYSSNLSYGNLAVERHGENFFHASREDAKDFLYKDDQDVFIQTFNKKTVINAIEEHGTFTTTYRLMMDGEPVYVNMKAVRTDRTHMLIGISNVDAQMKHQEALERVKEERITYARITALSGDYIGIYTVNPDTDHYIEYSATQDYEGLGLAKEGENFFEQSRIESLRVLYLEDVDLFTSTFKKETVFEHIKRDGLFVLNYRLMMDGEPRYVCLKAALIQEKDGPQLIVGVTNIDAQVKRDKEYANNLSEARNKANLDELTGVKNKHAYVDVESQLNRMIDDGTILPFAIVVLDINGLKAVNDTQGHQAGDA
ncbi:MAG: EAL domain-containing protein, partial [Lachnospiraceae bacterium]|nr:EAL domain-containing protein [Lachnospiraceae bacterium]